MVSYDRVAPEKPLVSLCINPVLDMAQGAGRGE